MFTCPPAGGGEAPGEAVPGGRECEALGGRPLRHGATVERVVIALERARADFQSLSHRIQQQLESLDAGGYLVALEPADRRLAGTGSPRQALLGQSVPVTRSTYELAWSHAAEL